MVATGNTVTWTDVATDETGYVVERTLDGTAWGVVGTTGANATTFTDPDVAVSQYVYRVRARNDRGYSAYAVSNGLFGISGAARIPVTAAAAPASGTVPLTVTLSAVVAPTTNPATVTWYFGDGTSAVGTAVTHTYTAFATYAATVVVTAPSIFGFGNDTGTAAAMVTVQPPALTAPANLAATSPARNRVALTWTSPLSDATSITVQRCVVRRCTTRTAVANLGGSAAAYTDATAKSGTSYTYRLLVANAAGATATSNEVTVRTR